MKKYIFFAVLALLAMSCEKKSAGYYEPAPTTPTITVTGDNYFIPSFTRDEDAPYLKTGDPIPLVYLSRTSGTITFTITENMTTLATVQVPVETQPSGGFYAVSFPGTWLVPTGWDGKIITITASNSGMAFTKFRVVTVI